jgi:chromosome segregation ATPase
MAAFPFLLKITGATVLTGAITLGAMTSWNGTETVNTAVSKIQEQAINLGLYEANETKLVTKINELKILRGNLEGQVNALTTDNGAKQQSIDSLNAQIADLDLQISLLEADITAANQNGETLAQRIDALEIELKKANADIALLEAELATPQSTDAPLTETEMGTVLETE